jgi:hypothetical protein
VAEQERDRFFLFLGDADREGVLAKLRSEGTYYIKKRLDSGPENWKRILELLASPDLIGVAAKFSSTTFRYLTRYEELGLPRSLFTALKNVQHIIFVHETFFQDEEEADEDGFGFDIFTPLPRAIKQRYRELLSTYGLNVVVFENNSEVSVIATQFVDDHVRNLIFRIYVPNGRMWAKEGEKLLRLFRDYLATVSGLRVHQSQSVTNLGVMHEFFADESVDPALLSKEFEDFSRFLDMSAVDPASATRLLAQRGLQDQVIQEIVDRYSKEARRLQVDLKQDRERRVLSIRHRMEAELVDNAGSELDWDAIYELVDRAVPQLTGLSAGLGAGFPALQHVHASSVTVNVQPQFVNEVHGIVAQEVSGTPILSTEATELLSLVQQYAGSSTTELSSAVYELEDPDLKPADRIAARQRLRAFLASLEDKVVGVGFGMLQTYLERMVGLG